MVKILQFIVMLRILILVLF
ncbi:hypothetical protein MTR67_022536 [Solanum verrucosum]|uniref:Uncharacterized protein n=1 Tax=Solanum verrucosum TaxID=315347 RepID=A0AAF0TQV0_SOLVR|nr:hypothetical protein MTR67_022536 [Solanum verrucosum]